MPVCTWPDHSSDKINWQFYQKSKRLGIYTMCNIYGHSFESVAWVCGVAVPMDLPAPLLALFSYTLACFKAWVGSTLCCHQLCSCLFTETLWGIALRLQTLLSDSLFVRGEQKKKRKQKNVLHTECTWYRNVCCRMAHHTMHSWKYWHQRDILADVAVLFLALIHSIPATGTSNNIDCYFCMLCLNHSHGNVPHTPSLLGIMLEHDSNKQIKEVCRPL